MMRLALALLMALLSIPALADIIPIPGSRRVKPVFDVSDLVCTGIVKSVTIATEPMPTNSPPGWVKQRSKAVVEIKDAYKGSSPAADSITVTIEVGVPSASSNYSLFRTGDSFLLFLKALPGGDYELADPFLGGTQFASVPMESGELGLRKLQDTLADIATRGGAPDALRALQILEGFDSLTDGNLLRIGQLPATGKPDLSLTALDVMLISGTAQSVRAVSDYLSQYKGTDEPFALSNISNRLANFKDPESLPWIELLTRSAFVSIRTGAMRSLRARRDLTTIKALIDRLDDQDNSVQYLAVISLAETLDKYDGDYAPSMQLFDKRPSYYDSLWKRWWEEQGKLRYDVSTRY